MRDTHKMIRVEEEYHRQLMMTAASQGMTIKAFLYKLLYDFQHAEAKKPNM